jgi:hypothetical protein
MEKENKMQKHLSKWTDKLSVVTSYQTCLFDIEYAMGTSRDVVLAMREVWENSD